MATFQLQDADVAAVYYKTGRNPASERLRQAPYFLVTYDDGTSGLVPIPTFGEQNGAVAYTVKDFEVDRIEIYEDQPMEFSKIGSF